MTHYIGLDGHSGTCTFVTVDYDGTVTSQACVPTAEGPLIRYVRGLKGVKKLALEESHISQWLYLTLKDEVDELTVCNPLFLGRRQGAKGDYRDGLHLANELRCQHLVAVHHEDSELWSLRSIVQGYLDATRQLTQTKNRYKALFNANAIAVNGSAVYKDKALISNLPGAEQFVATLLFEQLEQQAATKAAFIAEFGRFSSKHPEIKRLCTVPGISLIRATIITALVCSPNRFRNKHKFWAYSMLVKYVDTSDGVEYGKRSTNGRRELKAVFDGAALTALKGTSALRKYYDCQRGKKVPHKAAKKATARKIAAICLAILKTPSRYDDLHEVKRERLNNMSV